MRKVLKFKYGLGVALCSFFVVLSYEMKEFLLKREQTGQFDNLFDGNFSLIFVISIFAISFFVGFYLANIVINSFLKIKIGRKLIIGNSWIEGFWLIKTHAISNASNIEISKIGITHVSYDDNFNLNVITYRKSDSNTGYSSISELTTLSDYDKKYTNLFTISEGSIETRGITIGHLLCDGRTQHPNTFEGNVVLFNEGIYRKQSAVKIEDKEIKNLMSIHGNNWQEVLINESS